MYSPHLWWRKHEVLGLKGNTGDLGWILRNLFLMLKGSETILPREVIGPLSLEICEN